MMTGSTRPPAPSRRQALRVAGGASLAAGTAVAVASGPRLGEAEGLLQAGPVRRDTAALQSGPTPRQPVQLRHHPRAGRRGARCRRRTSRGSRTSSPRRTTEPPTTSGLVADLHLDPLTSWTRRAGDRGGWDIWTTTAEGWCAGDLAASAAGGHAGVLGEPPQRPRQRRLPGHRARRTASDPSARPRALRQVLRRHPPPGHADLPRRRTSTRTHPNENLARELLELHTVGVGLFDEDDVKASARILTG